MAQSLDPQLLTLASAGTDSRKSDKNQVPGAEKGGPGDFARVLDGQRGGGPENAGDRADAARSGEVTGNALPPARRETAADGGEKDLPGSPRSGVSRDAGAVPAAGDPAAVLPIAEPGAAQSTSAWLAAATPGTAEESPVFATDGPPAATLPPSNPATATDFDGLLAGAAAGPDTRAGMPAAAAAADPIAGAVLSAVTPGAGNSNRETAGRMIGSGEPGVVSLSASGLSVATAAGASQMPGASAGLSGVFPGVESATVPVAETDGDGLPRRRGAGTALGADAASRGPSSVTVSGAATAAAPGAGRADWIQAQGAGEMGLTGNADVTAESTDGLRASAVARGDAILQPVTSAGTAAPGLTPMASSAGTGSSAAATPGMVPEYALDHAPEEAEFPREVAARMKLLLRDGIREARLQLHPAELGRLQVSVSAEGDQAKVTFVTETAAAREAIEQSMPRLREMLEQNGLQLAQSDVAQRDPAQQGEGGPGSEGGATAGISADAMEEADDQRPVAVLRNALIDTYI